MSLSKSAERAAMERIASILLPMSMHTDTYGVGAMMDMCQAWARSMDTDMPLDCFTRDREAVKAEMEATRTACKAATERAEADAARIIKAAEDKAQRIARICHDNARQAIKAMEGV